MGANVVRRKYVDLTGMRFHHWTVLGRADKRPYGGTYWVCQCDCGNISEVDGKTLRNGRSTNCGCSNKWKKFHGAQGAEPRLKQIWANMMQRCHNSKSPNYPNYGGRGITVCEEWQDFRNFVEWAYASGFRKDIDGRCCSLDRVDVNGDYGPSNCRWVPMQVQLNNKRTNVYLTVDGRKMTLAQWAREIGVNNSTVSRWHRLYGDREAEKRIEEKLGRR